MNSDNKTKRILEDAKINVKIKLSALWVVFMMFYTYADIFSLYRPGQIDKMMSGLMGPFPVTQMSLLTASILTAIPAVMIFLSLALKPKVNRWVNMIVGILYILVGIGNLIGETWAYYITYGVTETVLTLLIVLQVTQLKVRMVNCGHEPTQVQRIGLHQLSGRGATSV